LGPDDFGDETRSVVDPNASTKRIGLSGAVGFRVAAKRRARPAVKAYALDPHGHEWMHLDLGRQKGLGAGVEERGMKEVRLSLELEARGDVNFAHGLARPPRDRAQSAKARTVARPGRFEARVEVLSRARLCAARKAPLVEHRGLGVGLANEFAFRVKLPPRRCRFWAPVGALWTAEDPERSANGPIRRERELNRLCTIVGHEQRGEELDLGRREWTFPECLSCRRERHLHVREAREDARPAKDVVLQETVRLPTHIDLPEELSGGGLDVSVEEGMNGAELARVGCRRGLEPMLRALPWVRRERDVGAPNPVASAQVDLLSAHVARGKLLARGRWGAWSLSAEEGIEACDDRGA